MALYGLGASSSGIKMRALSSFLLIFYNQVLGMAPATVALAITLITVFDALVDPVIGYLSDNLRSRLGRRHPFMYGSAIPVGFAFFFLWNPPHWLPQEYLLFYLLGCLMLLRTSDTCFELPSIALAPELVEDYDRRTSIVSMRIFFRTLAGLLFTIAAFQIFLSKANGGVTSPDGYLGFSLAGSIVMTVAILTSTAATHKFIPWLRKPEAKAASPANFISDILHLLREPAARIILVAGMLTAIVSGARSGLEIYFGLYFWQLSQAQLSILAMVTAGAALLGTMILSTIGHRFNKRTGLIAALSIGFTNGVVPIVLRLFDLLPPNGSPVIFALIIVESFFTGVFYVMCAALMNSMLADVVEELEVKTGKRSEGLLFSADAFFTKAVSGLGILISGGILSLIAFPAKAIPGGVPSHTLWMLGAIYVPMAAALVVVVIALLVRFPISRFSHANNLALLGERKRADTPPAPLVGS